MLIEAAKGGHTTVVQMLIDYPNSLVTSGALDAATLEAAEAAAAAASSGGTLQIGGSIVDGGERVPPPGSEATPPPTKVTKLRTSMRGGAQASVGAAVPASGMITAASAGPNGLVAGAAAPLSLPFNMQPPGPHQMGAGGGGVMMKGGGGSTLGVEPHDYDMLHGPTGYVLEDLERKGLDAKSYIQTMLRRTEGSSKEEQIYQKEQILAELQRVEKELQEKAQAQLLLNEGGGVKGAHNNNKREAGEGKEDIREGGEGACIEEIQPPIPFSISLDQQLQPVLGGGGGACVSTALQAATTTNSEVLQNMSNQLALSGRSLAALPPSERPKAKPSRKIDGKGGKKSQLQAALQQHSQQLAQLQQLQQLNQQLQQQVVQQRQLKQQNQQTLAALQQNAIQNQQQLAALQQNVAQLQQLEQTILAQQTTAHQQQHQQLQHRVQQIMQQKHQLQHQIKQFQQQVIHNNKIPKF